MGNESDFPVTIRLAKGSVASENFS